MKYANNENAMASAMDATLKDPKFTSMFSSSAILEKLAFTRVADEGKPTELEIELLSEPEEVSLEVTASDAKADCVACGKKRADWKEGDGVCKCASKDGCSPLNGCKEGCSCGCKTKKAGVVMDTLIKSAFDSLMKASSDLDAAGFESLSANTIVLMNDLIVEAKAKKSKKDLKKDKEKADAKAAKEKAKARAQAEQDKNDARDKAKAKADKEKAKADKEKARAKAEAAAEKAKKSGK